MTESAEQRSLLRWWHMSHRGLGVPDAHLTLREKARAILDQRSNDDPITITDPALMREIARVNMEEYECKLSVEYRVGDDVRYSHGYTLTDELDSLLPNTKVSRCGENVAAPANKSPNL